MPLYQILSISVIVLHSIESIHLIKRANLACVIHVASSKQLRFGTYYGRAGILTHTVIEFGARLPCFTVWQDWAVRILWITGCLVHAASTLMTCHNNIIWFHPGSSDRTSILRMEPLFDIAIDMMRAAAGTKRTDINTLQQPRLNMGIITKYPPISWYR